jgi:hemoglobin-like flavoprotein
MTEQEIKIIKSSWAHLRRIKPKIVADVFYTKLFIDNPSFRKMFPSDIQGQYEKLIRMLNIIVMRLERFDELTEEIKVLAIRHTYYGVLPKHYDSVGKALIWTLKTGLSHDWNEETEKAWVKCYTLLSDTMIRASMK